MGYKYTIKEYKINKIPEKTYNAGKKAAFLCSRKKKLQKRKKKCLDNCTPMEYSENIRRGQNNASTGIHTAFPCGLKPANPYFRGFFACFLLGWYRQFGFAAAGTPAAFRQASGGTNNKITCQDGGTFPVVRYDASGLLPETYTVFPA